MERVTPSEMERERRQRDRGVEKYSPSQERKKQRKRMSEKDFVRERELSIQRRKRERKKLTSARDSPPLENERVSASEVYLSNSSCSLHSQFLKELFLELIETTSSRPLPSP